MRVFVTGGTGFIGAALVDGLVARGDDVVVLTRNRAKAADLFGDRIEIVEGDPGSAGEWQKRLNHSNAVVNLVGESVAGKRWTAQFKQLIHDTRVEPTRYLVEAIASLDPASRPKVLLSASGIDYYPYDLDLEVVLGYDEEDAVLESTPSGSTFLARVCRNWEAEAKQAQHLGLRVALMRFGLVLGAGGALAKMTTPFRFFVGGRIGNGRQWTCWIHIDDVVGTLLYALDRDDISGPVNVVAPAPVRNREFSKALGKAMKRPAWMPVPGFAVRAIAGEFAEYILNGRRVIPKVLNDHGYEFVYKDVQAALDAVFS